MSVMTPSSTTGKKRHDTLAGMTGKSGKGTARQTIRVDEALWESFGAVTSDDEGGRSGVLRDFMRWYTHEKGAKMPRRPALPVDAQGSDPAERKRLAADRDGDDAA